MSVYVGTDIGFPSNVMKILFWSYLISNEPIAIIFAQLMTALLRILCSYIIVRNNITVEWAWIMMKNVLTTVVYADSFFEDHVSC